jgi:hypothetical protein
VQFEAMIGDRERVVPVTRVKQHLLDVSPKTVFVKMDELCDVS